MVVMVDIIGRWCSEYGGHGGYYRQVMQRVWWSWCTLYGMVVVVGGGL